MSAPQAILHHRVLPSAASDSYSPNQTVDFLLQVPARKLLSGSIRIEGDVTVLDSTGTAITKASRTQLDCFVGAHAFFDQFSTEVESKGQMEVLQNYPRMVNMMSRAGFSQDDLNTLRMGAELRAGGKVANGHYALQPIVERSNTLQDQPPMTSTPPSFTIKPMVCFNRSQGGMYSFDKMGFIRVSTILSSNLNAVFGLALAGDAGSSYSISNLACRYVTIPDDGVMTPQLMRSYVSTVNSVQSTASSLVSRVPSSRVNGVAISFSTQSNEGDVSKNSLALESLPNYVSTEYLFANSTSQNVTYVIRDKGDSIQRGIDALSDSGHTNVSVQNLAANNAFLVGIPFNEYLDLSQQLFSMRLVIDSTTITSAPMNAYSYFSTLLSL